MVNMLYKTRYSDLCYGYNVFWTRLLPVLDLPLVELPGLGAGDMIWGDGFEIETLINVRVAAAGARITEVGSCEKERLFGESNLNAVTDGLRVLRTIMAERGRQAQQKRKGMSAAEAANVANADVTATVTAIPVRESMLDRADADLGNELADELDSLDPVQGARGA